MNKNLAHAYAVSRFILGVILGATVLSPAFASEWTTYGYDIAHTGDNPVETTITADNVSQLSLLWSFNTTSGILTQPLFAEQVPNVNGQTRDLVVIGNLDGSLFALDANDGSVQWTWSTQPGYVTRHCPGPYNDLPNGRYGMIGTPVIDRSADGGTGRIYVGLLGKVYALSLSSGIPAPGWTADGTTVVVNPFNRNVPSPDGLGDSFPDGTTETGIIVYSALSLNAGKLYVEFGGISCDVPQNYHGRIAAIDTSTAQLIQQWHAVDPASTETGGSIWGASGAAIDPLSGVFVATGNTMGGVTEDDQYGEHVVKLSLDLSSVLGSDDPSAAIPPLVQGVDHDFGSNPIIFQPQDCPNSLAAVLNKNGELLIYARDHLGDDINFPPQAVQIGFRMAPTDYAGDLIGAPAWNASLQQLFVSNNSDGSGGGGSPGGLVAFGFAGCRLNSAPTWVTAPSQWSVVSGGTQGAISPPTTAHDVVYVGTGISADKQPGAYAFDARPLCGSSVTAKCAPKPGQILWQSDAFNAGVYTAPTMVNGVLYVPSMDGILRAYGLPPLLLYAHVTDELIASVKAGRTGTLRSSLIQPLKRAYRQFLLAEKKMTANKTRAAQSAYKKGVRAFSRFEKILGSKKAQKRILPDVYALLNSKARQIDAKLQTSPFPVP